MAHDPLSEMISIIQRHSAGCAEITGVQKISERVVSAIRQVPREQFVPPANLRYAYEDSALAIGHGQTISQPFIVALMCELLQLKPSDRVLEIGTGSGYHAAVLSRLCQHVYGLEIIEPLANQAKENLKAFKNVSVYCRDGGEGLPEEAPFDAISVAAAAEEIPPALIEQLAPGGRMILPLESGNQSGQRLILAEKTKDNHLVCRDILPVVFVPFV